MSIAQEFYDSIDDTDESADEAAINAQHQCISFEDFNMQDVTYTKFYFEDGSSLCFGNNGYIGAYS